MAFSRNAAKEAPAITPPLTLIAPGQAWSTRIEETDDLMKRGETTQWVRDLPDQSGASRPEASLACARGDPGVRSVDSEQAGCVIEPRKSQCGANGVQGPEGSIGRHDKARAGRPTGVRERGMLAQGCPGTWESLSSPTEDRAGLTRKTVQAPGRITTGVRWERRTDVRNRYRRPRQTRPRGRAAGIGVPHSTAEAGEPTRGTPWRKGSTGPENRRRERWERHRAHQPSQRNCDG